ncbi:uncharacterized protein LOC122405347 [Colletes gigas]|uniref:uncharacterized protein LOC122405347 n=1 Tax=Colletes gigas TaxID=935657 RepID=UPI001C9B5E18|nr:uncharacterized protein LOC122405347 [Colletes gigas]XP_043265962.1 uncharacterized protein LOC122405347 [Colletes gigas]XP_043265963.1 uncharacterized protein LOC122405347 [Colletes gigas]
MTGQMYRALLLIAILSSVCVGQQEGMDWQTSLNNNIQMLNQQIQRQVQATVQQNLAHAHGLTRNLNESTSNGSVSQSSSGNSIITTTQSGMKVIQSGVTSGGRTVVRETKESIVNDTLRHVVKIYEPPITATTNTIVFGFTLDLNDVNAKPVPINEEP